MRFLTLSLLLSLPLLLGCPRPIPPPPPGPSPVTDGGSETDEARRPCLAVCRRLTALGCPSARPTAEGASCTVVCENLQSSGVAKLDVECMKKAASCEAADKCNNP